MDDRLERELRAAGRAARAEAEAGLDLDAELARVRDGTPSDVVVPTRLGGPNRGTLVWLGAAAAVTVAIVGGVWLLGSNADDSLQTAEPESTASTAVATTVATTVGTATATTVTTEPTTTVTTEPVTTEPVETGGEPVVRAGSIDLGPDDLIARSVDGDVWWYPGALTGTFEDRILLIDRDDPRPLPDEGEGPNSIHQVAGTFNGSLVYSDCCEPVSGNLFAIAEPGAEGDLRSSGRLGDRAQTWGVGYEVRFEPGGTRVVTSNWDLLQVIDLATGRSDSIMMYDAGVSGGLDATWADGAIALLAYSEEDGWIVSVRDPDRLATELDRVVVEPPDEVFRTVDIVGVGDGDLTIAVRDEGEPLRFVTVETGGWTVIDGTQPFDVPSSASYVRLADGGDAMAWVVDDVGVVQRLGSEPFTLDTDLAAIWFPEVRGTVGGTPTTTSATTSTVPGTTIPPTTVPSTEAVDWRTLPYASAEIDECEDGWPFCTRVIHDPAGTPISYAPDTRTLTRQAVPAVTTTLPESYGDVWLYHAGPDDVVYLQVSPAVPGEMAADLVAVTLADGDAGREIGRWSDVVNIVGDSELVATPRGLVNVNCCGPDSIRPAPDAEVLVPWLDRSGSTVESTDPSVRVVLDGSEVTVQRTTDVTAGTREWTFEPAGDVFVRGMPQVIPTFDGGFVAAFSGDGTTVVRGWPTGDLEQVVLAAEDATLAVALDRDGRVIVDDGDTIVRVEAFTDRTPRPAGPIDVDVETGALSLPDLSDVDASWLADPVAFAAAVDGGPEVNEIRSIEGVQQSEFEWVVTVTVSNLFDDSAAAVRWELVLQRSDVDGRFSFVAGTWSQVCQPGRGHQDFDPTPCT